MLEGGKSQHDVIFKHSLMHVKNFSLHAFETFAWIFDRKSMKKLITRKICYYVGPPGPQRPGPPGD